MRWAWVALATCWLSCVAPVPRAHAADYDPQLTWRTIVTEHFRIHFHQGEEALAEEFSHLVERVYDEMSAEMRWRMRMRADVVLIDRTDQANGFAGAVPVNGITLYVTAPTEDSTLSLYEDWNEAIFTHELTHVLHMETHGGLVTAARAVVGRIASTNAVSPWWIVEGLATFQETRHTSGGRGRSAYVDMIKRAAVLEDAWPPLGNLDGFQAKPPSGNLRYLFGQSFLQYVADHQGEDVWTRWTHAYGRSLPYLLFLLPPKRVFGKRLQALYREWREHEERRYGAQIDAIVAEGLREGVLVSDPDASCASPAFSPDGSSLVWSCYDLATGNALWIADGDGSNAGILQKDVGARSFTWRADGKAFVYAGVHLVNRYNYWSDIYLFDLKSKRRTALTAGARARDPEFSPDGSRLLVVTNRVQRTKLAAMTVDQRLTDLLAFDDDTQLSTPRYAPSGTAIALSVWKNGRRDLWIARPDGTLARRLTADAAIERDPAWSSDGRWLFFSSDRDGVPNIYAVDVETERLWRVTNVRTGAARPSVSADFRRLAYEQYSADGWEVRLLDLDPSTWDDRGLLPAPVEGGPSLAELVRPGVRAEVDADTLAAWDGAGTPADVRTRSGSAADAVAARQDGEILDDFEQAKVKDAFGEEQDYPFTIPPRRYNPTPSLIPRYWLPVFGVTPRLPGPPSNPVSAWFRKWPPAFDIGGLSFTASTGAQDPLRRFSYAIWADYRTDANQGGGGATFVFNRWIPVYSFGFGSDVTPYTYLVTRPWQPVTESGTPAFGAEDVRTVFMRSVNAWASISYPFTVRSTFFTTYAFTWRTLASDLEPNAWLPSVALRGTIGNLTLGYRYAWNEPTALAISPEDGRTLVVTGTVAAPWTGTFALDEEGGARGLTQVLLSVDWREYVVNPAAPNHVFAFRGGAGVAFGGRDRFLGNYQLGGNGLGAARAVRGYPFGADRGDSYWLLGAEYRFPVWRMDRGFGTFPLFFRYLAATIFAEAGNAFDEVDGFVDVFDDTLVGVGAELRLSTLVGWARTVELRLGYAVGLTQDGYWFDDPRTVYFLFHSNF